MDHKAAELAQGSLPNLKEGGQRNGLMIGPALNVIMLNVSGKYRDAAAREFSIVTPENEMKWDTVHPSQDLYDFCKADSIVQFSRDNGMHVRGHTLTVQSQLPATVRK